MSNKPEILAPAGSMEALYAAVRAGADACYVGGELYSARAFAGNFNQAELLAAIDYCHIHDVKLYLAVNTLLKNEEIGSLVSYLEPFYMEGVDGAIVQDVGVLRLLSRVYPDLPLHGSTQMSICSRYGAEFLKACGLTRVVPARELSLNEIKTIKEAVDIEIETFVHGAMCFSYSGKCLMSSFAGGRSGNRGRCAQPCRKAYSSRSFTHEYALSMKDMCLLPMLPELISAGIDSFKIEGRMKKPEYVAATTVAYAEVTDAVLNGQPTKRLISYHIARLMDIYNRGGFSSGYYMMRNGKEMLANHRPNHTGTRIGRIVSVAPPNVGIALETDIHERDVLEICSGEKPVELTSNVTEKKGQTVSLRASGLRKLKPGMSVYRTRNNRLLDELRVCYLTEEKQKDIYGTVTAHVGCPLTLTLSWEDVTISATGCIVEQAKKRPVTQEQMLVQLSKTGGTNFNFRLNADICDDGFVTVGSLNALRRDAVKMLETALISRRRRTLSEKTEATRWQKFSNKQTENKDEPKDGVFLTAVLHTVGQWNAASKSPLFDRMIVDASICKQAELGTFPDGKKLFLAFPEIFREHQTKALKEMLRLSERCGGICIKNLDELGFLQAMKYQGAVLMDALLYAYNDEAAAFLKEQFADVTLIAPVELTHMELRDLNGDFAEKIYGYQSVMVTAQCFLKNYSNGCEMGATGCLAFHDEQGNRFFAENHCADCYTILYNGVPTDNIDRLKNEMDTGIMNKYLIDLTFETEEQTKNILKRLEERLTRGARDGIPSEERPDGKRRDFTRGHYLKGID